MVRLALGADSIDQVFAQQVTTVQTLTGKIVFSGAVKMYNRPVCGSKMAD
jgi:hypothetical protein